VVAKLLTTRLSVKPGRVMAGKRVVDPVGTAMASVALSTIATVLPLGLKTAVDFPLGASVMSEGCKLMPVIGTKKVRESLSNVASTMFSTCVFVTAPVPFPCGKRGFEMKTRNLIPLGLVGVVLEELEEVEEVEELL
jgi:hypothetical protein